MSAGAHATFGSPMSLGEDADIARHIALGGWHSQLSSMHEIVRAVERDMAISDRRWRGATRASSGAFVPGDVPRFRGLVATWLLDHAQGDWESDHGPKPIEDPARELSLIQVLYAAVPYFLPATAALGIMASRSPEAAIVDELRLPYPVVTVWFSESFEIPDELRGGESVLAEREVGSTTCRDVLTGTAPPLTQAPEHIRYGTLAAYRGESLSVLGVVLTSGLDGGLGELIAFILAEPVAPDTRFHVVEGTLSNSMLRALVINLAAAVTWGSWEQPEIVTPLPVDPSSRDFRAAIRRGAFRRSEPRGVHAGVRVLDAPRMFDRTQRHDAEDGAGSGSPAAHLRRAHWHRYRVGPRDGWHYETRWIPPVVVNPDRDWSQELKVYRLPLPEI